MMGADFDGHKEKSLNTLKRAMENGEVDEKVIPLLDIINKTRSFFTTSSCSGRISLSHVPLKGKKKDHKFVAKWHRKVKVEEVAEKIGEVLESKAFPNSVLWLKFESFILHIGCRDLEAAEKLINLCIRLGFKRSGAFRITPFPFVEVIATDYVAVPVGINNRIGVSDNYIRFVVEILNGRMEENDRKLRRFTEAFENELASDFD